MRMGRMSKAEAEQAAAAARARQAVEGRVNAAEAAATEAWRQVGVTRDELKLELRLQLVWTAWPKTYAKLIMGLLHLPERRIGECHLPTPCRHARCR